MKVWLCTVKQQTEPDDRQAALLRQDEGLLRHWQKRDGRTEPITLIGKVLIM